MAQFKVVDIVDGYNIRVKPSWSWKNKDGEQLNGNSLRIRGFELPNSDNNAFKFAKEKLDKLLKDQHVVLKNPIEITDVDAKKISKISCEVYLNDVEISNYFPEYKNNKIF